MRRTMLAVLATYVVHSIALPAGMTVDLTPPQGAYMMKGNYWAPASAGLSSLQTIAISPNGSIGILINPHGSFVPGQAVLIVRPNGSKVVLAAPTEQELSKTFRQSAIINGDRVHPGAYFEAIRFARDGTPFATVAWEFSGAFSGIDKGVFEWNGAKWINTLPAETPYEWSNVELGAADMPWRAAYNVTYSNQFVNLDYTKQDLHYQEFWTYLNDGEHKNRLGYGCSMAMNGTAVVGFSSGQRLADHSPPGPVRAWELLDGKLVQLGLGVAYGINAKHEVVGDGMQLTRGFAIPVLWRNGKQVPLSDERGSALAIADNGTIVGQLDGEGFIVRGNDPSRKVLRINSVLASNDWYVDGVYGIAASGRLLAVGHRAGELPSVLVLDPN